MKNHEGGVVVSQLKKKIMLIDLVCLFLSVHCTEC